ncbi:MAG: hypothetical protein ABIQ38_09380 [Ilumatobacteraceae bacterium]
MASDMTTVLDSELGVASEQDPPGNDDPTDRFELYTRITSIVIVAGATLFLLKTLHLSLILRDNTPTGGDMGAHVWGPAYLRDHLLGSWRLSGWSMDWYGGFPVYRFYMVVPALLILLVDLVVPYGVAIKIIAVIGILTLPLATWIFGRLARFAFPIPELLVLAATVFLYDESFTIYGGNIASTMAGEFSFSIALTLAMIGFGLFAHGMYTGERRILAAVVIALAALCHGVVLIFVFIGVGLMMLIWRDRLRIKWGLSVAGIAALLSAFWVVPFITGHAYMTDMKYEPRPSGSSDSFWKMFFPLPAFWNISIMLFALIGFGACLLRRHLVGIWLGVFGVVLAIFVFISRDSLPVIGLLWNPRVLPFFYLVRYMLMMIGIYEAVAGIARFVALEELARSSVARPEQLVVVSAPSPIRSRPVFNIAMAASLAAIVTFVVGFHFQELPFGKVVTNSEGTAMYKWGPLTTKLSNDGFVDGWARWNFQGYEGKATYGEYYDVVQTMQQLGDDPNLGCGRALWENSGELNKYGTTMSLMLLPFWTDGCIGSMEGLFFEAAGTTPYHFVTAAAMSKQSSNPVRELRYDNNDATKGVRYLQQLGVKYFMGFTPEAIKQASAQTGLTEIARSGPWVIYKVVAGNELVVPLEVQPVVVQTGSGDPRERWLEVGMSWFQNPDDWSALPVADGPSDWQRVKVEVDLGRRIGEPGDSGRRIDVVVPSETIRSVPLDPVNISDIKIGESDVKFTVDQIGVPVLLRVSYFPNWHVSGAKGPYRVAPNMMVVIPTSTNVHLTYGRSSIDVLAYLLTFLGIGLAIRYRRRQASFAD